MYEHREVSINSINPGFLDVIGKSISVYVYRTIDGSQYRLQESHARKNPAVMKDLHVLKRQKSWI